MVSKMYRLFSGIYTVSSINNGILTLKIFEWSLVCSSPARIGGRASYIVGTDKEARAANSDASLLGTKRARPIAISTGGFFSWTRLWLDNYSVDAVISLVAPRSYQPIATPDEVCPIKIEESLDQPDNSVATTTVTAANRVSGNRARGSTACCSCIALQPEREGKQPRCECEY